jgi:very-short-patch-repair endonuclease
VVVHKVPDRPSADVVAPDRARRLFEFLGRLVEMRSRPIRDVAQYREVVWLADLPDQPEVRLGGQTGDEGEPWLSVDRPRPPIFPEPPALLRPWIDLAALREPTAEPALRNAIPALAASGSSETAAEAPARQLADEPEVLRTWDPYLPRWRTWAADMLRIRPVLDLYARLFGMEQDSSLLGEQYEVVLGIGLLTLTTEAGPVRRHLITARGRLRLAERDGRIEFGPGDDGVEPIFETEMLDARMTPPADLTDRLRGRLAELGTALLDPTPVVPVLESWINVVSKDGYVDPAMRESKRPDDRPYITLAPAIILRPRSQRSLAALYRAFVAALEAGAPLPKLVHGLVEILEADDLRPAGSDGAEPGEVFFPLPANDEQRRIVERLRSSRGVVVVGPPGTGKSHTIANLVSDALARGQRVVVTSHTGRALEVLVDKLPDDFRDLCVIMAGEGRGLSAELRRSIDALLQRSSHPDWSREAVAKRIASTRRLLEEAEDERAGVLAERRRLREQALVALASPDGRYSGTLARIAARLADEAPALGWLGDPVEGRCPLDDLEARELLALEREFAGAEADRARRAVPARDALLRPPAFAELLDELAEARDAIDHDPALERHEAWAPLRAAGPELRSRIRHALRDMRRGIAAIPASKDAWVAEALGDVLDGLEQPWIARAAVVRRAITTLDQSAEVTRAARVTGLAGLDLRRLRGEAQALALHYERGGGNGFGFFVPRPVKVATWLKLVRVDGAVPDNRALLTVLLAHLEALIAVDDVVHSWDGRLAVADPSLEVVRGHLAEIDDRTQAVLALQDRLNATVAVVTEVDGLTPPGLSDPDARGRFERVAGAIDAVHRRDIAADALRTQEKALETAARVPDAAEAVALLAGAVHEQDRHAYATAYDELVSQIDLAERLGRRDALASRLGEHAPALVASLRADPKAPTWDERLACLAAAWSHASTSVWARSMQAGGAGELDARLARLSDTVRGHQGRIGAYLAWQAALGRLTQRHKAGLQAYKQFMSRVGKGTGKYAAVNLAHARAAMSDCIDAVPAWIMPTYRLAETLTSAFEPFDLAIVDEASQSGVEGLFVWALAKQVIVVGDDQQISPDAVGVDLQAVATLQAQLLKGIPYAQLFAPTNSLFDQAQIRYPGALQLREHFRCMPEIIAFSNEHFYRSSPLQPVRQFGSDRLAPLQPVHVEGAEESNGVNRREAQALIERIAECCVDPRYENRSMGVISLTGDQQARFIQRRLLERLGPDAMLAHRIKCGDAYAFQGDERDVMFLSLVAAPSPDGRRLTAQVNRGIQQRFNVASSRARDQAFLFHSVTLGDLNPDCMRAALLSHFIQPGKADGTPSIGKVSLIERDPRFDSLFEQRVFNRIVERGYAVIPQFEVLGRRIDLVVVGEAAKLAVECDGDVWHGPEQYDRDTARQLDLERCGWRFVRIVESDFYLDPDEALQPLWATIERLGINPTLAGVPRPVGPEAVEAPDTTATEALPPAPPVRDQPPVEIPTATLPDEAVLPLDRDQPPSPVPPQPPPAAPREPEPVAAAPAPEPPGGLWVDDAFPPRAAPASQLEAYRSWQSRPVPVPAADKPATRETIMAMVAQEGPILAGRIHRLFSMAMHRTSLGPADKSALNQAIYGLIHSRRVAMARADIPGLAMAEWVLYLPGSDQVALRALGPRRLMDVPLTEVAAAAAYVRSARIVNDDETIADAVIRLFGVQAPSSLDRQHITLGIKLLHGGGPRLPSPGSTRAVPPAQLPAPPPRPGVPGVIPQVVRRRPTQRELDQAIRDTVNDALDLGFVRLAALGRAWGGGAALDPIRAEMAGHLRDLGLADLKAITKQVVDRLPHEPPEVRGAVVDGVLAAFLRDIAEPHEVAALSQAWADARGDDGETKEAETLASENTCAHGKAWGACLHVTCPGHFLGGAAKDDWRNF